MRSEQILDFGDLPSVKAVGSKIFRLGVPRAAAQQLNISSAFSSVKKGIQYFQGVSQPGLKPHV
jgi:hypothetical protein